MADPKLGNFELILSNRQTGQTGQDRRTNRKIRGTCTIAPFGGKKDIESLMKTAILAPQAKILGFGKVQNEISKGKTHLMNLGFQNFRACGGPDMSLMQFYINLFQT